MREQDAAPFVVLLSDVFSLYPTAKQLTDGLVAMYFRALATYPFEVVQSAFDAHVKDPQRGRFAPLPADVIAQIEGLAEQDGRPGPEEAWAIALRSSDEAETVVWTAEIAEAMAGARPVLAAGDEVGARMAFREVYTRLLDAARRQRMPAAWTVSLGFDTERRGVAIRAAVACGRLPESELRALPAPAGAPRLEMTAAAGSAPPAVRDALRDLADRLRSRAGAEPQESADAAAKRETAERKAAAAALVRGQEAS